MVHVASEACQATVGERVTQTIVNSIYTELRLVAFLKYPFHVLVAHGTFSLRVVYHGEDVVDCEVEMRALFCVSLFVTCNLGANRGSHGSVGARIDFTVFGRRFDFVSYEFVQFPFSCI